jgi:hypothetical protein
MTSCKPLELITPSERGPECVSILKDSTGNETHWAEDLQQALARLREQSCSAVVIDQFLLENEPAGSDQVLERLGTSFPVYLNFASSGMERLLREVRSALQRRQREESQARRSVELQFRSAMCESLTAMLLSCELAMAVPKVPPTAAGKILAEDNLAREMRLRLGANECKNLGRQIGYRMPRKPVARALRNLSRRTPLALE